jgi:hypothetical protein
MMIPHETRLTKNAKTTKLTWNNLAYDSNGFMTSVYQFVLISLIKLFD